LNDLDPVEVMIHLRHNYIEAAKDLCKNEKFISEVEFGEACLMTACLIDQAIDTFKDAGGEC